MTEEPILAGRFQSTAQRAAAAEGLLLVLQDTTEFVFQRSAPESIGYTKNVNSGRDKEGR
ncbi:MAG: IS4 family transposase, partial [Methylobacteriaceae bacterium]|nr:IS4 family transposase [Methylobacteriaceae bacterium]